MKNQTKKQILMSCLIALSSLFLANGAFASTFESKANGSWTTSSTWQLLTGSGSVPGSGDIVTIKHDVTTSSSNVITVASISISSSKSLTNAGQITITGNLTGSGTLTQSATGILILGGTNTVNTFSVSTAGNIVKYNSASAQDIRTASYKNLVITGVGVKTTLADLTVADLTVDANSTMTIGTGFKLDVSGNFLNNGTFNGSTDDVTFQGNFENNGTYASGSGKINLYGDFTNDGTFTAGTSTVYFKTNGKSFNGSSVTTFYKLTLSRNNSYTNNTDIIVSNALGNSNSSSDASTLILGANDKLTIGGTISSYVILDVTNTPNTIEYSGTSQTVRNLAYSTLLLSGTNTTLPTFTAAPSTFEVAENKSYTSNANLTVNDFKINTGATFEMGSTYTLNVKGNYTNNGTFTGNTANITFNGTAAQTIGGTATANDFKYMILNNTAGLTLSAKVNVFKVLTVTAGELKANSNLTIKSKDVATSTGTAQVTQLPASGASITGNVTVERFIPAGTRSYRHLSCPVNSVSIFNSWQEAGANNAGFGVQITGTTANRANIGAGNAANGLDYTLSSGYSMYTMTTSNVMSPVTNTQTTNFTPGLGYNIFIRGDRQYNLYTSSAPTTNTQTTLRATGLLNQGDVTVSLCNGWNIIGNPYASTIAWNASGWSAARGANITSTIYVINPAMAFGNANRFACHNGVVGTNGWTATGPYIESGQGFYVYTTAATSITFKEEYKTSNEAAIYFKNNSIADLLRVEYLSNGVHQDDIAINFREGGKTILDRSVDAETMASATNGIASLKNASRLAINTRPLFETLDTVALSVMSTTTGRFSMKFTELASFSGMTQVVLVDKFLNKMINIDQNVTYNFDITANPNSKGNNRFVMLFSKVGTAAFTTGLVNAAEEVSNVSLYPNPATSSINLACSNANVRDFSYEIYNQMGQSVSTGAGNFANGNIEAVNIDNLDKGIYFVKMFYNNNVEIIRFVK